MSRHEQKAAMLRSKYMLALQHIFKQHILEEKIRAKIERIDELLASALTGIEPSLLTKTEPGSAREVVF